MPHALVRLLTLVLLALAVPLRGAAPAEDPAPALLSTIDNVLDLTIGHPPETIISHLPKIRATMEESFATHAIVQRAFGRNWAKLTPAQQKDVIELLGQIIIRTYASQLSNAKRPKVTIVSSKLIAPERREIISNAAVGDRSINIVYRMAPIDGRWKVYDVIAENISVVGNYRQQFDAHFEKKGAIELVDLLREKLNAPIEENPTEPVVK